MISTEYANQSSYFQYFLEEICIEHKNKLPLQRFSESNLV